MLVLEKTYYQPYEKFYSFNAPQKILLFEKSKRYVYKCVSLNAESNFLLLKRLEKRSFTLFKKPLLCSFLLYLNTYKTFFLSDKNHFCLRKNQFYKKYGLHKIIRKKKALLVGCILKKVKGGFIVDIRGFICFLPFSLSKSSLEKDFCYLFPVRLFSIFSLSLQCSKNKSLSLSIILSSKANKSLNRFLKKTIS
jgi:hypothetical protein